MIFDDPGKVFEEKLDEALDSFIKYLQVKDEYSLDRPKLLSPLKSFVETYCSKLIHGKQKSSKKKIYVLFRNDGMQIELYGPHIKNMYGCTGFWHLKDINCCYAEDGLSDRVHWLWCFETNGFLKNGRYDNLGYTIYELPLYLYEKISRIINQIV